MTWTKAPPAVSSESFWCWVKYRGKNGAVKCPARVTRFDKQALVSTAKNDSFIGEGKTWRCCHAVDATLRFGPMIEEPS